MLWLVELHDENFSTIQLASMAHQIIFLHTHTNTHAANTHFHTHELGCQPALLLQVCYKTCRGVRVSCMALKSDGWTEQSNWVFQKCALKIIYSDFTSGDNAYAFTCILADLQTDVNILPDICLSRWRTLITAWTIYYLLRVTLK